MGDYIVRYGGTEEDGFVVTNITPIAISGTKTWLDNSNAYGTRPDDLNLTLYRSINGGAGEEVEASPQWTKSGDLWTYRYNNLPLTDDAGNIYTYRVEETEPEPEGGAVEAGDTYEMSQDGYDLTNRLTGTTEVTGAKTWIDDGDGTRPDELTLTLFRKAGANGEKEAVTGVTPEWSGKHGDTWTYRYENLPKYDENGVKYIYSVEEAVPDGYGLTDQDGYDLTNTQLTSVDVQKIWGVKDGNTIPEYVTIGLYRTENAGGTDREPVADEGGNQITINLSEDNNWSGTFDDLLKYDPQTGARYYYSIAEIYVSGDGQTGSMDDYIVHYGGTEETGFIVTNIEPVDVSGTKTWLDDGNAYGTRPDDLELTLYRSINGGDEKEVLISPEWAKAGDRWTYRYIDLPLTDDEGNIYTYRVEETKPEPEGGAGEAGDTYEMSQDGYDLTNRLTGTTEVTGTKTWIDDEDGTRPDELRLTLTRKAGENGEKETVTGVTPIWSGTDSDTWTYRYEDLPKYDENGVKYIYSVEEAVPDGYGLTDQSGYDLTNTQLTSVDVQKIWGVNAGDTIPEYVTIGLYRTENADGTQMEPVADENGDQVTIDLRDESGWQGTFDDLLKYNPQTGARYYYGIAEIYVSGGDGQNGSMGDYIVRYGGTEEDGFIVTNITPIAISGTKTWLDNSNAYGTRPDDLELTLYRSVHGGNEEVVEASPEWTKDADQWTYRYIDLPLTDDAGNVYTYRVEEIQAVPGGSAGEAGDTYEMSQDGFDFTNVLTGTTEVTGTKTWRDNGRTQRGPIVLTLYANGEAYDELTLEGEGDVWEYAFTELPKYDENGAVIEYTVRENDPPEGYDVNYTEEGIENIQKGALILEKTVTGTAGETDRKFSFTITLSDPQINGVYGNVAFVDGKAQVTLSHGESVEIYGLPAYVDYTVVENGAEADGYTVTAEGDSGTIQPGENSMVSFENHKDKEPAAKTGDGRELTLYSAIAVISAMTAAILLVLKKRVK